MLADLGARSVQLGNGRLRRRCSLRLRRPRRIRQTTACLAVHVAARRMAALGCPDTNGRQSLQSSALLYPSLAGPTPGTSASHPAACPRATAPRCPVRRSSTARDVLPNQAAFLEEMPCSVSLWPLASLELRRTRCGVRVMLTGTAQWYLRHRLRRSRTLVACRRQRARRPGMTTATP